MKEFLRARLNCVPESGKSIDFSNHETQMRIAIHISHEPRKAKIPHMSPVCNPCLL